MNFKCTQVTIIITPDLRSPTGQVCSGAEVVPLLVIDDLMSDYSSVSEQRASVWRLSSRCARHMGDVGDTGCDTEVWSLCEVPGDNS